MSFVKFSIVFLFPAICFSTPGIPQSYLPEKNNSKIKVKPVIKPQLLYGASRTGSCIDFIQMQDYQTKGKYMGDGKVKDCLAIRLDIISPHVQ